MAAEIRENKTVEAPTITDSEAANTTHDDSHYVGSNAPSINGTSASISHEELSNKHIADIVDDLVNSAEPSVSGGSDTEASRIDALKDGDKGHVRTSSAARKPATFKAVSVNKTFLAAKSTSSAAAKPGDKPSPTLGVASLNSSSTASSRPRLVAKTGGLVAKGSGGVNGRPAAAPDPTAVWNKNRPVPPPDPKKFTDEELKKYGIHMASRLQQDDAKGQANWADIDDDDDDWAPEEIRWTDGTKSTIPHHEEHDEHGEHNEHGVPAPLPSSAHDTIHYHVHGPPPYVSLLHKEGNANEAPKSPALVARSPITKPGHLPSGKGLILKGAAEKPTLVAKPPAPPTPVKSPWAPLPPVDKASPAAMDMQPPTGMSRMQHHQPFQQLHSRDHYGPPPSSTPPPHFKEIAADDFSRGGFRDGHPHMNRELFNSQSGRLEPVVDRRGPPRGGDVYYRQAPGTTVLQRPSQMSDQPEPSPAFQTHRSSVAEPGPYGRRRGSSNVSGGSGNFLQRIGRPNDQHVPADLLGPRQTSHTGRSESPASPRNFSPSGSRSWQSRGSPSTTFSTPYGNAPQPDGRPPTQGVPAPSGPSIDDELELQKKIMRERRELAKKRRLEEEAKEEAARRERIQLKLAAMGPAPERKSAKKEHAKEEAAAAAAAATTATMSPSTSKASPETSVAATAEKPDGSDTPANGAATLDTSKTQQQPQSWQQNSIPPQPERLASWSSNQGATRNVWAAPNMNNRGLGNGTFNADLVHASDPYAPSSGPQTGKPGPGPIAPPASSKNTSAPSIAPIGPPKSAAPAAATQGVAAPASSAGSARSAWASAVKTNDDKLLAQQKAHRAEQQREAEARGMSLQDLRPSIKDTWMPTRTTDDGDRIEEKSTGSVVHRPGNTPGSTASSTPAIAAQQARPSRFFPTRDARQSDSAAGASAAPSGGKAGGRSRGRPESPSPPPPDMDGHPAFDGDATRPHVSLPRSGPHIVVRLPPKDEVGASASQQQHGHPQLSASQWNQPQPSEDSSWQAKFDHLFDRKAVSPSKPSAGAGRLDARAKSPIEGPWQASQRPSPTTVQAISRSRLARPAPEEPVISRSMAEECFERQEMGSLPPVHLPHDVPELAWKPAAAPKALPRRFALSSATSRDLDTFLKDSFGLPYVVSIRLPGTTGNAKTVNLPLPRNHSNPRRSNFGRSRHVSGAPRGGGNKARDGTGGGGSAGGAGGAGGVGGTGGAGSTHGGSNVNENRQSSNSSHGGRPRGGARHRSENWTRSSPAPIQS